MLYFTADWMAFFLNITTLTAMTSAFFSSKHIPFLKEFISCVMKPSLLDSFITLLQIFAGSRKRSLVNDKRPSPEQAQVLCLSFQMENDLHRAFLQSYPCSRMNTSPDASIFSDS